jgi:hypothetical protein
MERCCRRVALGQGASADVAKHGEHVHDDGCVAERRLPWHTRRASNNIPSHPIAHPPCFVVPPEPARRPRPFRPPRAAPPSAPAGASTCRIRPAAWSERGTGLRGAERAGVVAVSVWVIEASVARQYGEGPLLPRRRMYLLLDSECTVQYTQYAVYPALNPASDPYLLSLLGTVQAVSRAESKAEGNNDASTPFQSR